MPQIQVQRGDAVVSADLPIRDMSNDIAIREPNVAPLTTVLTNLAKNACNNHKYEHLEDQGVAQAVVISGSHNNSVTTLAVVDASSVVPFTHLHNPLTGENFLVTARDLSLNQLTVATRPWGATSAAVIADGQSLTNLGTAKAQGAALGTPLSSTKTAKFNYTEISESVFKITGTLEAEKLYGGPDLSHQEKMALIDHKRKLEKKFLFGTKGRSAAIAADGNYLSTTAGLKELITQNIQAMGGVMTHLELLTWIGTLSTYSAGPWLCVCSGLALRVINTFALGQIITYNDDKTFGLQVMKYRSAEGTLNMVKSRELTGTPYGGYMFALDLGSRSSPNIYYRFLRGRDTKLYRDVAKDGGDYKAYKILTECGMHFKTADLHGAATGITG